MLPQWLKRELFCLVFFVDYVFESFILSATRWKIYKITLGTIGTLHKAQGHACIRLYSFERKHVSLFQTISCSNYTNLKKYTDVRMYSLLNPMKF